MADSDEAIVGTSAAGETMADSDEAIVG